MLTLGELNAMAGKRLPDLRRRFGCRGLRDPHRIDRTRHRPAFGERVCLRQCCRADRRDTMERKGHVAVALSMAAIGIGLSGVVSNPVIIMALLCFAQIGVSAVPPMIWPLPASFLTGASAAAGIAAINSLGNLSGFAGPYAMGYLKDLTGSFTTGLLLLAGFAVLGAVVVLSLGIDVKREQSSGNVALAH